MALITTRPEHIIVGEGRTQIRVRNLWLLYLWASELYHHLDSDERWSAEHNVDELPSLAAKILSAETTLRFRRTPTHQYVARHAALPAVRGRIDHLSTARHGLLQRGMVACTFEELSVDTPRNRYVLAALDLAGRRVSDRDRVGLRQECLSTAAHLERIGVSLVRPDRTAPRREAFGHHDRHDRRMVAAAQLVIDLLMPSYAAGALSVPRPPDDEGRLRRLFEDAVRNFASLALPQCRVSSRVLSWPIDDVTAGGWFPSMKTDITIDRPDGTRLVIDTKFTTATRQGHYSSITLREEHLYQLYAYLRTQERATDGTSRTAAGMLLYPETEASGPIDVMTDVQCHPIRVATVDLMADGQEVRRRLRQLIGAEG